MQHGGDTESEEERRESGRVIQMSTCFKNENLYLHTFLDQSVSAMSKLFPVDLIREMKIS